MFKSKGMFMRIIVFVVFLLSVSVSLLSADMTGKITLPIDLPYSLVIKNQSIKSIPLYSPQNKSKEVIALLPPKKTIKYKYQGDSGKWKYGLYDRKIVLVRSKHAKKGSLILKQWFLPSSLLDRLFIVSVPSSLALCVLLLMLIVNKKMRVDAGFDRATNHEAIYHYNETLKSKQDVEKLKKEAVDLRRETEMYKRAAKIKASKADHYFSQYQQQQEKTKQANSSVLSQQERFEQQIKNMSEDQSYKLNVIKKSLWDTAQEEALQRHQVTVEVMRNSYSKLEEKYNKVVNEAKIFGVDFFDGKYESVLKGRRFELFVVKKLVEEDKFSILEWTPDKGFEAGIVVAANKNPDLVVRDCMGRVFAIECKFRSNYFFKTIKENAKEITWASDKQLDGYRAFARERNIPVLVAIGLKEESSKPKWNYLINLNDLAEWSRPDLVNSGDIQMICPQNSIYNKFVRNGDYGAALIDDSNHYIV
jgi:hypothetical protein